MNDIQTLANIAGMTAELIESGKLVRVIRCKDCKHILPKGFCHKHSRKVTDDWFCADGEQQEGWQSE